MKVFVFFAFLLAVASADNDHDNNSVLDDLVFNEVSEIINSNYGISVDDCTSICDGLFYMTNSHDEYTTDRSCRYACDCEINFTCHHHVTAPSPN